LSAKKMSVIKMSETRAVQSEYAPYIAGLLARERERRRRMQLRSAEAMEVARKAAAELRQHFGVTRVRVFGSVLRPHRFHERSDIDLAVEGLPKGVYLKAWALLNSPGVEFEIDLVASDECRSAVWESAMREGVDV
jgi:predicted nucleotidyltransferase